LIIVIGWFSLNLSHAQISLDPKPACSFLQLIGTIDESPKWGSGWINISKSNFQKGDSLKLDVGGSAKKIIVRLLKDGDDPNTSSGAIGEFDIPKNRVLFIQLSHDYPDIIQISANGGPHPWQWSFPGNGQATIRAAWYKCKPKPLAHVPSNGTFTEDDTCSYVHLAGTIDHSEKWGSGWINISKRDFMKGSWLKFDIGESAKKVVVRLLKMGDDPNTSAGAIGVFDVPAVRILEIQLSEDFQDIIQISIHGGPHPWHWDLGAENGPAKIRQISYKCRD
jgi:hypothetical protein